MSYKEKAVGEYRGGAVAEPKPKVVLRYPCFAAGCPMPGTMFAGKLDNDDSGPGSCAWHWGVNPTDIPRVTSVMTDWSQLAYEVNECRRVHTAADTACDPKAQDALFRVAVERLRPFVQAGGWGEQFEAKEGERYANWGRRLETFLGGKVVEVLSIRQRRAA